MLGETGYLEGDREKEINQQRISEARQYLVDSEILLAPPTDPKLLQSYNARLEDAKKRITRSGADSPEKFEITENDYNQVISPALYKIQTLKLSSDFFSPNINREFVKWNTEINSNYAPFLRKIADQVAISALSGSRYGCGKDFAKKFGVTTLADLLFSELKEAWSEYLNTDEPNFKAINKKVVYSRLDGPISDLDEGKEIPREKLNDYLFALSIALKNRVQTRDLNFWKEKLQTQRFQLPTSNEADIGIIKYFVERFVLRPEDELGNVELESFFELMNLSRGIVSSEIGVRHLRNRLYGDFNAFYRREYDKRGISKLPDQERRVAEADLRKQNMEKFDKLKTRYNYPAIFEKALRTFLITRSTGDGEKYDIQTDDRGF